MGKKNVEREGISGNKKTPIRAKTSEEFETILHFDRLNWMRY